MGSIAYSNPDFSYQPEPWKTVSKASPFNIQISASETPGRTHVDTLRQESAEKVSELLMLNHAKYHTLFDFVGFHNHIVHHTLTLWALGATPSELQASYDLNKSYQLLTPHHAASVSVKLRDLDFFNECLGNPKFYGDFLKFFQDEIAEKGVQDVVNDYAFKGDERADSVLARMHSGFLHPLIHLGFGLEFHQPCLVAESLAAACIHDDWPALFLLPAENYIRSNPDTPSKPLLSVIEDLHRDPVISSAVKPNDPLNRISDGLLARVSEELLPHLAKFQVKPTPEDLAKKTAETIHVSAYILGAAQNPRKLEALDFVMMHMTTLSVFYPTFMKQDWISNENKKRLLEWKGWSDAVMYAGCGCPRLYPKRITNYAPKKPQDGWQEIIHRANAYADDGHTSKLIRALLNTETESEPFYGTEGFPLRKEDIFKIAHITMDSVERMLEPGYYKMTERVRQMYAVGCGQDDEVVRVIVRWVRWCGVEGAWDDVPDIEDQDGKNQPEENQPQENRSEEIRLEENLPEQNQPEDNLAEDNQLEEKRPEENVHGKNQNAEVHVGEYQNGVNSDGKNQPENPLEESQPKENVLGKHQNGKIEVGEYRNREIHVGEYQNGEILVEEIHVV